MTVQLVRCTTLTDEQLAEVTDVISEVTRTDGRSPLSEHVLLHLHHSGDAAGEHLLAYEDGGLAGYAHLESTVDGPTAEIAVKPGQRRHGIGRALVSALVDRGGQELQLWAHGEQAAARDLATSLGFSRARVLWHMRRSLLAPLDPPLFPADVHVRPFDPQRDRAAWLRLNGRAFADLPDQGSWTAADLDARLAEPWFDPAGFLLAWRGSELLGAHWTKVHGHRSGEHEAFGEVYVLATDPSAQGTGLGRALLLAGLEHLRERGLKQAMLYVDAANAPAIALYEANGFVRWDTDVLYRHP
jgi:mycothiol synthase